MKEFNKIFFFFPGNKQTADCLVISVLGKNLNIKKNRVHKYMYCSGNI